LSRESARPLLDVHPPGAVAGAAAPDPSAELAVVQGLLDDIHDPAGATARGLRRSVGLGALALVLVVAAYALEQL
jgi:hypothetical protein